MKSFAVFAVLACLAVASCTATPLSLSGKDKDAHSATVVVAGDGNKALSATAELDTLKHEVETLEGKVSEAVEPVKQQVDAALEQGEEKFKNEMKAAEESLVEAAKEEKVARAKDEQKVEEEIAHERDEAIALMHQAEGSHRHHGHHHRRGRHARHHGHHRRHGHHRHGWHHHRFGHHGPHHRFEHHGPHHRFGHHGPHHRFEHHGPHHRFGHGGPHHHGMRAIWISFKRAFGRHPPPHMPNGEIAEKPADAEAPIPLNQMRHEGVVVIRQGMPLPLPLHMQVEGRGMKMPVAFRQGLVDGMHDRMISEMAMEQHKEDFKMGGDQQVDDAEIPEEWRRGHHHHRGHRFRHVCGFFFSWLVFVLGVVAVVRLTRKCCCFCRRRRHHCRGHEQNLGDYEMASQNGSGQSSQAPIALYRRPDGTPVQPQYPYPYSQQVHVQQAQGPPAYHIVMTQAGQQPATQYGFAPPRG